MAGVHVDALDHLVLTVASVERTTDWYVRVLGMRPEVRAGRHALHFGREKVDLHQADHTFDPKALRPTPGSADLCFRSTAGTEEVLTHLAAAGVPIETGPIERHGALGAMTSVYVRDPTGT